MIVANNNNTTAKLISVMQMFVDSCKVQSVQLLDDFRGGGNSGSVGSQQASATRTPHVASGSHGLVCIGPLGALHRLQTDSIEGMTSLLVEDVMHHDPKLLQSFLERMITIVPTTHMFILSSQPPSAVAMSIRYLLRRRNRRYYFQHQAPAHYAMLLCNSLEDRLDLVFRAVQLHGFKSVVVLTHNREVIGLRNQLAQDTDISKVLSIQRNTSLTEHDRVLSDFLRSPSALLVGMDAYTGIDLMDVDCVVQMYPPQKSMPEPEWLEYLSYLETTRNPSRPTVIITLIGPEELPLVHYFFKRLNIPDMMPVLNVSPTHPQFGEIVRKPAEVLAEKLKKEKMANSSGPPRPGQAVAAQAQAAAPPPLLRSSAQSAPAEGPAAASQAVASNSRRGGSSRAAAVQEPQEAPTAGSSGGDGRRRRR
jgi:hypothetical protein